MLLTSHGQHVKCLDSFDVFFHLTFSLQIRSKFFPTCQSLYN
jgi:hypothetical protein